jgi:hypothetical protein
VSEKSSIVLREPTSTGLLFQRPTGNGVVINWPLDQYNTMVMVW